MAVAINMPNQRQENKESDLDKLARLVQMGGTIYQGYDTYKQAPGREADAALKVSQAEAMKRRQAGQLNDADILELSEKHDISDVAPKDMTGVQKFSYVGNQAGQNGQLPVDPGDGTMLRQNMDRYITLKKDKNFPLLQSKNEAEIRKINAETDKLKRESTKVGNGRDIPANDAILIGGADAASKALEDMSAVFGANPDITGPGTGQVSKLKGWLEWGEEGTRAKTFDAQAQANAQIIGKFLEGGKLAEGDIKRYRSMLPGLGDSPEAAQAKIQILQNLIAQKQQAELGALKNAGFNTGNLSAQQTKENPNLRGLSVTPGAQGINVVIPKELQGLTPDQQLQAVTRKLIEKQGITSTLPKRKPGT